MADLNSTLVRGKLRVTDDSNISGTVEASTIKKTGGTSSQFLKADGSVDSNTYLQTAVTQLGSRTGNITIANLKSDIGTAGSSTLGLVYMGDLEQNTSQQYLAGTVAPMKHTHSNYLTSSTGVTSVAGRTGTVSTANLKSDLGLGSAAYTNTGTSSGNVPVLDSSGKLNTSVLPAIAITDTFVCASESAMLALTAEVGDICVRTDLNKSFVLKTAPASTLANWQELLTPTDAVTSVNGATGAVTFGYLASASVSGHTLTLNPSSGSAITFNDTTYSTATTSSWGLVKLGTIEQNTSQQFESGTVAPQGHTHSNYLPLSGGTLTGNLNLKANQYNREGALNCNNSDILGVNSIYTQDTADNTAEGIRFYRDSTHYDSFTMSGGVMYFVPNDTVSGTAFSSANVVLHSGNIGSYAITSFAGTGSATTAARSDHNHDSTYLGKTAKAADADKLDGNDSSYFLDTSATAQTKTGNLTLSGTTDVSGGTLKLKTINAPTTSGGTTYGAGTSGQILKSNGTTVYWASDSNTNYYHTPSYSSGLKIGTGTGVNDLYVPDATTSQKGVLALSSTNLNTMINQLSTGSSTPTDNDYYVSQYVGGGTSTTTYHRRPMSALWAYVKSKGDDTYLGKTAQASDSAKLNGQAASSFALSSIYPNDSGEIKTKFRVSLKGETGGSSTYWYYKLVHLPANNNSNYASAIISGRIGGWSADRLSSIYCLAWNRGGAGYALLDIGGTGDMSTIFNIADFVSYTNNDDSVDIYIKVSYYFVFDLNVEVFQSTATISYDGTYVTSPSGTLAASASTSTSRLQLENGTLKVNGNSVITSNNIGSQSVNYATTAGSATPTSHASSATTYGVGTSGNYGHVKLKYSSGSNQLDGYALGINQSTSGNTTTSLSGFSDGSSTTRGQAYLKLAVTNEDPPLSISSGIGSLFLQASSYSAEYFADKIVVTSQANVASPTYYTLNLPRKDGTLATLDDISSGDTNYYPVRSYSSGLQISGYVGSTNCQLYVPYMTASQYGVAKCAAVSSLTIYPATGQTAGNAFGVEKDAEGKLFVMGPKRYQHNILFFKYGKICVRFTFISSLADSLASFSALRDALYGAGHDGGATALMASGTMYVSSTAWNITGIGAASSNSSGIYIFCSKNNSAVGNDIQYIYSSDSCEYYDYVRDLISHDWK